MIGGSKNNRRVKRRNRRDRRVKKGGQTVNYLLMPLLVFQLCELAIVLLLC